MLRKKIIDFAKQKNILIGFCDADKMDYLENISLSNTPFVNYEKEERINPKFTMPSAKSIIVIGIPYAKVENFKKDNEKRGRFSIGSVGLDYHIIVKNILNDLVKEILTEKDFEYKIFVDTGPLLEREIAKKSGLGYQGKNQSIISNKFGSYFFIGYMMIDFVIEVSEKVLFGYSECGDCCLCIKACPTKALRGDYTCNTDICISYLTQKKEEIDSKLKKKMGNALYGCDICQKVCPKNKDVKAEKIEDINILMPKLENFVKLTNKEFKNIYGHTAIYWRGKKTLQRNAIIAMENVT